MRAIPSRIESVGFTGVSSTFLMLSGGQTWWQCPSGAIERRAFEVSTDSQQVKLATASAPYVGPPVVELRVASTAGALDTNAFTSLGVFTLGARFAVSFSVEPEMYYAFRVLNPPAEAQGLSWVSASFTFERQA